MEIWNPTHDQPGQRGIQLGYMYERLARKVGGMAESARVREEIAQTLADRADVDAELRHLIESLS